jgi:hypothetical protein
MVDGEWDDDAEHCWVLYENDIENFLRIHTVSDTIRHRLEKVMREQ